jgi:hypothetical protein
MLRTHFIILFIVASLSLHLTSAQDSEEFDEPLSKKEAEQTLRLAEDALENAERAQSRDDIPGIDHALENYSRNMNKLERGIHEGNLLHDEHEDVAEIVAEATYKHTSTLEELYDKVPDEAHQGIERALDASKRGHETALENLSERRREELTQRHERQRRPSSTTSRSSDSLHGSRPSTGPGTVGGPGLGGSQRGQGRGRR